jgi:membrane protein required for colicin V production
MAELEIIDWIFLLILVGSLILGLIRGIVREVVSLAGLVASFMLSRAYAGEAGQWLASIIGFERAHYAVGFVVVFIAVMLTTALAVWLLGKLINAVGLMPLDRFLGGLFGIGRGLMLLVVIAFFVNQTPMSKFDGWRASVSQTTLAPLIVWLSANISTDMLN